jgi:hemolysin D
VQETPVHPAPRRAAIVICTLFTIALLWSVFGHIDIVAVAPGRIVVSDNTKLVQPLEAGVVRRVLVKDGDAVRAGQVLVELDATAAGADRASVAEQLVAAHSEERRSAALIESLRSGVPPALGRDASVTSVTAAQQRAIGVQLAAEWQDIAARLARHRAEATRREAEVATVQATIAKLDATLPIAQQREGDFRRLTEQGFISGHATQDRTRERIEQERDLATQRARLAESQAAVAEAQNTRAAYLAETQRQLSDRQAQAATKRLQLIQEQTKAEQRNRLAQLSAPVAGTVQQLAVHTEGGVVTPAQVLMVIVPAEARLRAEVVIDNKDIGFVSAGQAAQIKLETFPFTRYGLVPATVQSVTADAVNDEKRGAIFPATLALGRDTIDVEGKRIRLSPGMNITAEVKTGRRRVIDYLLSPVARAVSESVRER